MKIEKIHVNKLIMTTYNPRKDLKPTDHEYKKLKRSIEEFGYVDPIIWNKRTGNIIGGHQRYKVLVELGYKELDCVVLDIDEQKEKALNVALNKISGEFDVAMLTDLLKDLDGDEFDVTLTGFDATEIAELFGEDEVKDDNFDTDKAIAEIQTPITKQGDLWLLGKHRLLCSDSTKSDTYKILMYGKEADLVLTDPPYNVDYEGATKDKLKIKNDKMKDEKFIKFLTDSFGNIYEHSKKGAPIYIFHADSQGFNFRIAFKNAGYTLKQCLVWTKNHFVLGRQDYQWKHEPILYGWKEGASHAWYGGRKQTTLINFDKPVKSEDHPTKKPVGLCGYLIGNSSKEGDIVLDPFGGSGSTLMACEQLNRICNIVELDEKYCDVIIKRFTNSAHNTNETYLIRDGKKYKYSDVNNVQQKV